MTGERAVQLEGAAAALAAAALFGVSAPLAKMLLPGTGPLPLAAFLYLGAGLGLTGVGALARGPVPREARLRRDDLPLLAVVIAAGGIAGPVLLLLGLQRVSAGGGGPPPQPRGPPPPLPPPGGFRGDQNGEDTA